MALPVPPQTDYGESKEIPFAHAQVTAGFAAKLWKAPRRVLVEQCPYLNPTGLAEDASNYFAVKIAKLTALVVADLTFTAANATEILTSAAHGLKTGDGPVRLTNSGGGLPSGLATATDYWIIRIDANTFYLAASLSAAFAGTAVTFTTDGTGTHTLSDTASTVRAVVLGSYSTDSAGAGTNTLPANTWTDLTLSSTPSDLVVQKDEEVALIAIEGGTATLPAGSGFVRYRPV